MQKTRNAECRYHCFFSRHLEHPYLLLTVVRKASPQPKISYFWPYESVIKKD